MADYLLIEGYVVAFRTSVRWRNDADDLVAEVTDHLYSVVERLEADGVHIASARTDLPTTLAAAELDGSGAASYRFYVDGTSAPALEVGDTEAAGSGIFFTGGLGLVLQPMADTVLAMVDSIGDAELVVGAELVFSLEQRPRELTLEPPRARETGATASIGFVLYHAGLPVNDFRYLSGAETVDLDWEDPWYSKFQNKNLWRQYEAPLSAYLC